MDDAREASFWEMDEYATDGEFTQTVPQWSKMDLSCLQPEVVSYLVPPFSEIKIKPYEFEKGDEI